jgi:serine/threonine protein kinase
MGLPEWDSAAAAQDPTDAKPTKPSGGTPHSGAPPIPTAAGSQHTRNFHSASPKELDLTGEVIAGYKVTKMLGAGGMGAVCLARQLSLDRDVALKILPGTFASNPEFLVRFTREALSAAQMTHHNIVQVYDVGSDNQYHFIAMEFVKGDNLGNMVKKEGPLRYEDACSFILQAARGLKFAHDANIIHRDIKPDNIMVNDNGIVKIADMGLAKFRNESEDAQPDLMSEAGKTLLNQARADLTVASVAMGTPSYMPPEQARDASTVDPRADQYSLGCTLWYLLTGKSLYQGNTAYEIIRKHMDAPLPNVDQVLKSAPPSLKSVVVRMLAKAPEDRYAGMVEVIRELEAVLGMDSEKGAYTPRERHLMALERISGSFYSASFLKVRSAAILTFFVGAPILTALCLIAQQWLLAGLLFCLIATVPMAVLVLDGILNRAPLFRRMRALFFGMSPKGWLTTVASVALGGAALYGSSLLVPFALSVVAGLGLAVGYHLGILRRLALQREPAVTDLHALLKELRLRGVPEEALQDFVCKFAGDNWEEMFETVFGYEDMLMARSKTAKIDKVRKRRRHGTWRDPIARWLDGVEERRWVRREKLALAKAEAQRLKAQGKSEKEAKKEADAAATQMLGDIQKATAKAKTAKPKAPSTPRTASTPSRPGGIDGIARLINVAVGSYVCLVWALHQFKGSIPAPVEQVGGLLLLVPVPTDVRTVMIHQVFGIIAGLAMVFGYLTVWRSTRFGSLLGGILILGSILSAKLFGGFVPVGLPVSNEAAILYLGLGLAGAGILWAGYQKSLGGKL